MMTWVGLSTRLLPVHFHQFRHAPNVSTKRCLSEAALQSPSQGEMKQCKQCWRTSLLVLNMCTCTPISYIFILCLMTKTLYRSVPIFALSGGYVHNNVDINNGMIRLFLNFLHFRVTIFSFAFGVMNYCFHCRRIMIGVPYCVRRTICVPGLDYMSWILCTWLWLNSVMNHMYLIAGGVLYYVYRDSILSLIV